MDMEVIPVEILRATNFKVMVQFIILPVRVNPLDSKTIWFPVFRIFIFTIQPPAENAALYPMWGQSADMVREFVVVGLHSFAVAAVFQFCQIHVGKNNTSSAAKHIWKVYLYRPGKLFKLPQKQRTRPRNLIIECSACFYLFDNILTIPSDLFLCHKYVYLPNNKIYYIFRLIVCY